MDDDDREDLVYQNSSNIEDALHNVEPVSSRIKIEGLDTVMRNDSKRVQDEELQCSWYHGKISREAAESLLEEGLNANGPTDGLFLVRDSTSSPSSFVLGVTKGLKTYHFQIKLVYDGHFRLDNGPVIQGLEKLITFYHDSQKTLLTKLTSHCKGTPPPPHARDIGVDNILHKAVKEGDALIVKKILEHSLCPDVNAKNSSGTTALHDCCKNGHTEIAHLLVLHKADVEIKDTHGYSPLHRACSHNHPGIVKLLLTEGNAYILNTSPKTKWVPIHNAAFSGHDKCIKVLLDHHSPLLPRASDGQTPLDFALKYNRNACVNLILTYIPDKRQKVTESDHWLHTGLLDRHAAEILLKKHLYQNGVFLVRESTKIPNYHVVDLCTNKIFYHYEVKVREYQETMMHYIDEGPYFDSLEHLIEHYGRFEDGMKCRLVASIDQGEVLIPLDLHSDTYERKIEIFPPPIAPPRNSIVTSTCNEPQEDIYAEAFLDSSMPTEPPPPPPETKRPSKGAKLGDLPRERSGEQSIDSFHNIINKKNIKLGKELGEGEFGEVKKGVYTTKEGGFIKKKINVAVKTFHQMDNQAAVESIIREGILMQDLDSPNVIKLYGIVRDPLMLVEEFIEFGALSDYLVMNKKTIDVQQHLYLWASQVATGMQYLEEKRIVHRDLAARNILVASEKQVKISDFGLSRIYGEKEYYTSSKGGRWPIKWYAPECVNFGKFDHKTDVWSFGVTLWEMFTFGNQPYDDMKGVEVIQFVESGKRLDKPEKCPGVTYQEMLKCWHKIPDKRPSFNDLHQHFQNEPIYSCTKDFIRQHKNGKK